MVFARIPSAVATMAKPSELPLLRSPAVCHTSQCATANFPVHLHVGRIQQRFSDARERFSKSFLKVHDSQAYENNEMTTIYRINLKNN